MAVALAASGTKRETRLFIDGIATPSPNPYTWHRQKERNQRTLPAVRLTVALTDHQMTAEQCAPWTRSEKGILNTGGQCVSKVVFERFRKVLSPHYCCGSSSFWELIFQEECTLLRQFLRAREWKGNQVQWGICYKSVEASSAAIKEFPKGTGPHPRKDNL